MIWGFSSNKNLKRIHLLQKRAVRIISHSHYLCPSAGLFSRMKILPVQDIVSLQTGIFMHDCFNGLLPTSLQDYFNLNANIHTYNTRNNHDLHPPLLRTERSKASMFYQGPVLWNKLPSKALVTSTLANAVRTIFLPLRKWSKIVRTTFVRVFVTKA